MELANNTRAVAISWWHGLSFEMKFQMMVKHKELVIGYPNRDVRLFTGSEVEKLYRAEHQ